MSDALASTLTDLDIRSQMSPGHELGLWVIRQILIELGGSATIGPVPSGGTRIRLIFRKQEVISYANAA